MIIGHDYHITQQIISPHSMQDRDHTTEVGYVDFSVIQINAAGELLIFGIDDVSKFIAGILFSDDVLDFSVILCFRDS
jgi:hypothetical protein